MTPRAVKPPEPPSITLSSLFAPLLWLILGIVIAKCHSGHLDHLTDPILALLPECPPNVICPSFYRRSRLSSGKTSTKLFDVPRRHLHSNYSALDTIAPAARIVRQWTHPRVVLFDGGFDPFVELLLERTEGKFLPTTVVDDDGIDVVDDNRKSDTAYVSPHLGDQPINHFADQLVRLVGLPNRHYSEVIEVNRYNETGFFAIHCDLLAEAAILDKGLFHGCQRVATAVLHLSHAEGGENVFVRDRNFKGGFEAINRDSEDVLIVPVKKGRLVVWFNQHPDTEEDDLSTWHGSMPVTGGQKLAATFYLRNCSHVDNSRRRAQLEDFMKNQPAPSAGVGDTGKSLYDSLDHNGLDVDDDDDEDDDDEDDDDKDDAEYLADLRRYRKIRDGKGNTTKALISAGYSPDEFEELDAEILLMDELGETEKDGELGSLMLYKKIKEEGGDVAQKLKDAGFLEEEFHDLDKDIEDYKKELEKSKREDKLERGGEGEDGGGEGLDEGEDNVVVEDIGDMEDADFYEGDAVDEGVEEEEGGQCGGDEADDFYNEDDAFAGGFVGGEDADYQIDLDFEDLSDEEFVGDGDWIDEDYGEDEWDELGGGRR